MARSLAKKNLVRIRRMARSITIRDRGRHDRWMPLAAQLLAEEQRRRESRGRR